MNEMINSETDLKNIGLLKNLSRLRQTLDVYCLISINAGTINKRGVGKSFFGFLQMSSKHLIALDICRVFEEEKPDNRGGVKYELDSIGGVLKSINREKADILDSARIREFVQKYGSDSDKDGLAAISAVIKKFRKQHHEELCRFKTLRDKWIAHSESGFVAQDAPSYDIMERLFNFGLDFYMLVARAFIPVVPADLNSDRKVKTSLKTMLQKLGCEDIKTEMA